MKKLIKTVRDYIQAKIDKYVVKRFEEILPKELITSLYRRVVERDFDNFLENYNQHCRCKEGENKIHPVNNQKQEP